MWSCTQMDYYEKKDVPLFDHMMAFNTLGLLPLFRSIHKNIKQVQNAAL